MYNTCIFRKINKADNLSIYDLQRTKDYSKYHNKKGVYYVYTSKRLNVNREYINDVYYNNKKIYDADYLYKKLLLTNINNNILYIGESGDIECRIKQLVCMMYSNAKKPRKGGICLKGLSHYDKKLNVGFVEKNIETSEIKEFANNNGFLPFANMKF